MRWTKFFFGAVFFVIVLLITSNTVAQNKTVVIPLFDGGDVGLLKTTVLNVNCPSSKSFSDTYVKIFDVGSFSKQDSNSTIEITFSGRIAVTTSLTGTGAHFELRVDDAATTKGRARASFKDDEVGSVGVPVSIAGIFTGLTAGFHTVSIWVRASNGVGQGAMVDPGCWRDDHIVIKEFK